MPLLGNAVVAIWNDIVPVVRADFIEWHNREHIPERVAIPGFRRGRRYAARYGGPEYFTLYEADEEKILSGPDYLARLNNPTRWTLNVTQAFRNTSRGICRVAFSRGCGEGGYMLTLRFDAVPGRESELERHLVAAALPPLCDLGGIVGIHLCVADTSASDLRTTESKGRAVAVPSWIALFEASQREAADGACDCLLGADLSTRGAHGAFERGLYALEICRAKESDESARFGTHRQDKPAG